MKELTRPGQSLVTVLWEDLKAEEEGAPHSLVEGAGFGRTLHVEGDFAGAQVEIQGSIISGGWRTMNDGKCDSLIFDEPAIKNSPDLVSQVRPKVLGGTRETKITVGMTARK